MARCRTDTNQMKSRTPFGVRVTEYSNTLPSFCSTVAPHQLARLRRTESAGDGAAQRMPWLPGWFTEARKWPRNWA